MSLRLIIEQSREAQLRTEMRLTEGVLSIGRGADCDWQLSDPEMFISRRHCVLAGRDGRFTLTDESSGGLYLNGADLPLGRGNSVEVTDGLRMQLGEIVIRARLAAADGDQPLAAGALAGDGFFAPQPAPVSPPRPAELPLPFDRTDPQTTPWTSAEEPRQPPPLFDDPFSLDLPPGPAAVDFEADTEGADAAPLAPDDRDAHTPPRPDPETVEYLMRGLGIDMPAGFTGTPEQLEALGQRFRMLTEGLVGLLRARAEDKGAARIAQTVIGSSQVNPLKFMPTTDEALAAIIAARGPGYLPPDAAIAAAFHDLHDHRQRSWSGLQSSLRRMIDRFDPALFEAEIDEQGLLRALVSGGRSARLWQHYRERYRDIARAAEDRFLGEVGGDFRDAYENRKEMHDD